MNKYFNKFNRKKNSKCMYPLSIYILNESPGCMFEHKLCAWVYFYMKISRQHQLTGISIGVRATTKFSGYLCRYQPIDSTGLFLINLLDCNFKWFPISLLADTVYAWFQQINVENVADIYHIYCVYSCD